MRALSVLTSTVFAARRALPRLLVACALATSAGSVTAQQQLTLGFDGAPSGPLPWSEQGFTVDGGGSGGLSTATISGGALRLSAFSAGYGAAFVERDDGGFFDLKSLRVVSVTSGYVIIYTDKSAELYLNSVGTTVFTGPEFESIRQLFMYVFPPPDTSYTVTLDDFVVALKPWNDAGFSLPGVGGAPLLAGTGSLSVGSANSLELSNAAPSAMALLFVSLDSAPVQFKGGYLAPFPILVTAVKSTSVSGDISIPFIVTQGTPAGTTIWAQWAIQDGAALNGVALSNAVSATTM